MFEVFGPIAEPVMIDFEGILRRINRELKAPQPGDVLPVEKETIEIARKEIREFITGNIGKDQAKLYNKYKKDASEQFVFEGDVLGEADKTLGKVRVDPTTGRQVIASDYMYGPKIAASRTLLRLLDDYLPGLPDSVHSQINRLFSHTPVNKQAGLSTRILTHAENLAKYTVRRGAKGAVHATASALQHEFTDLLNTEAAKLGLGQGPVEEIMDVGEEEAMMSVEPEHSRVQMIQQKRMQKQQEQAAALEEKIISTPLPRNTQKFLENAEFAVAKLSMQRPDIAPQWQVMLKHQPWLLEDHLIGLQMEDPSMLEHDPFGRINNKVVDQMMKSQIRRNIANDPEITNLERVEQLDELNRTGIWRG